MNPVPKRLRNQRVKRENPKYIILTHLFPLQNVSPKSHGCWSFKVGSSGGGCLCWSMLPSTTLIGGKILLAGTLATLGCTFFLLFVSFLYLGGSVTRLWGEEVLLVLGKERLTLHRPGCRRNHIWSLIVKVSETIKYGRKKYGTSEYQTLRGVQTWHWGKQSIFYSIRLRRDVNFGVPEARLWGLAGIFHVLYICNVRINFEVPSLVTVSSPLLMGLC